MENSKRIWQEEQERVDRVIDEIDGRLSSLEQQANQVKSDIVDIRKNFWDDVRINFADEVETTETVVSIKQQAEVLAERERRHRTAQKQVQVLKKMKSSPYFGRIDFTEHGEEKESIYLGIASLVDEQKNEFLIYDWRAPVCSLYYDYPPGPARYETPGGTVEGVISLKRQFLIKNGIIESLFDTGITIGDQLLQEVLGKRSDSQMKSIVATIQQEQNRIIRNEKSRLVIVQGAAGSGKTSAALQRVAYLLYRYRNSLKAENILLFSPNPMFNRYVSTVLPELGEENMQQTTFQELLEHQLKNLLKVEDPFSQIEYTLTAHQEDGYEARIAGIRYKASRAYIRLLDRYLSYLGQHGALIFRDIPFRGGTLIPAGEIKAHFASLDSSLPLTHRISLVKDRLMAELKKRAREEVKKDWVDEEIQWMNPADYIRADQALQKDKHFTSDTFDDLERERHWLAKKVVQKHIKPAVRMVKNLRFLDIPAIYRQLFADPNLAKDALGVTDLPETWPDICRQTVAKLEQKELFYEDTTPLLYLKTRLEGMETDRSIRHVFIDEAQDYSPFQFFFLKRLFPRSKMTILGDFNQAVFSHTPVHHNMAELSSLYGKEQTELVELKRSYRSTFPIIEFTRHLAENKEAIEPFERPGNQPTVTEVQNRKELHSRILRRIETLQKDGHETIAVICKTAAESQKVFEALNKETAEPVQLITKESVEFRPGILVIPVYLAKGIEFDAVILYDASGNQYHRENERKLLYTACTRAMHALHLYCLGKMSPFIKEAPRDTYRLDHQ
jgi:DNA helicase II / ATP-dependent DNA helicase PcrA